MLQSIGRQSQKHVLYQRSAGSSDRRVKQLPGCEGVHLGRQVPSASGSSLLPCVAMYILPPCLNVPRPPLVLPCNTISFIRRAPEQSPLFLSFFLHFVNVVTHFARPSPPLQQNLFDKERIWTNLTTEARGKVAGFVDFDWGAALCPGGPAECGADTRVGVREVWTVWAICTLQHAASAVLECAAHTPGWVWGG